MCSASQQLTASFQQVTNILAFPVFLAEYSVILFAIFYFVWFTCERMMEPSARERTPTTIYIQSTKSGQQSSHTKVSTSLSSQFAHKNMHKHKQLDVYTKLKADIKSEWLRERGNFYLLPKLLAFIRNFELYGVWIMALHLSSASTLPYFTDRSLRNIYAVWWSTTKEHCKRNLFAKNVCVPSWLFAMLWYFSAIKWIARPILLYSHRKRW